MRAPAVDAAGNGVITNLSADVKPGTGKVFVDVYPFFTVETQQSSRTAASSASDLAKIPRNTRDFFYEIHANAELVDGPSGGLALSLLTYSELTGSKIRHDLTATGTISADGSVGKIGGVMEKAKAAADNGIRVFLIPVGQATQDGVDLTTYGSAKWGLQVIEVRNLADAVQFAFTPEGSVLEVPTRVIPDLSVKKVSTAANTEPFRLITEKVVSETEAAISRLDHAGPLYKVSKSEANASRYLLGQGYYYSAANTAFLTKIAAETALIANASDLELKSRLEAALKRAAEFQTPATTTANLEWVVGAQLRRYWAIDKLNETRDGFAAAPRLSTVQGIVISENWLEAGEQLATAAKRISANGAPIDDSKLRGYASSAISDAAKLVEAAPDGEAALRLKTAREEFSAGQFAVAATDATFAHAFARAAIDNGEKTPAEAAKAVAGPEKLKSLDGAWSQLYYTHSLYSVAEWNRSGDAGDLLNSLKLQQLAKELDSGFKQIVLVNSGAAPTPSSGQGQVGPGSPMALTVTATQSTPFPDPRLIVLVGLVLVLLSIIAIAYGLRTRAAGIRRPSRLALREMREKLDRLDGMLVDGKVSEANYDRLRAKYGKLLHEMSAQIEAEESATESRPQPRPKKAAKLGKAALRRQRK
jgi:uncharacterized protein